MLLADMFKWAAPSQPSNEDLRKQLAAAIAMAAVAVLTESANTANHANRLTWAKRVIATRDAPIQMADQMAWGLLGNATIQAALATTGVAADSDVSFVVASLIDVYAP